MLLIFSNFAPIIIISYEERVYLIIHIQNNK